MKSPIITLLYAAVVCASTDGQQASGQIHDFQDPLTSDVCNHKTDYTGYEQQCPDAEDISPCVCTYDSEINATDLNCTAVEGEDQLKQIFKSDFPFKTFRTFHLYNNNNIKVIESEVFNGISFEQIYIKYNALEVIESQALDSSYETATVIDLYGNKITSFPFDELSHFSKLNYFTINHNSLSMIPADAFNGLTTLEKLYMSVNTPNIVGTFEDIPNLQLIYLDNNNLTTIPTSFIKTGSSDLKYIGLYQNNITSVEPDAFDIVEGLNIYIFNNFLSALEEATWRPYLESRGMLWAGNNPLVCSCELAWLFGEDQLLEQVSDGTRCEGNKLHELDPSIFDQC